MTARMTDAEITELATGLLGRGIFCSAQVPDDLLPVVFMPLTFMSDAQLKDVGICWEYLSKANSNGVNGFPVFASCHLVHHDDWPLVMAVVEKVTEVLAHA